MTDKHPENNRVLHELLGKCWHEPDISCYLEKHIPQCKKCHKSLPVYDSEQNPNYAVDPRLVLDGMREKKEEWYRFQLYLRFDNLFDLILDRNGRLRDLAIEFFKQEGK